MLLRYVCPGCQKGRAVTLAAESTSALCPACGHAQPLVSPPASDESLHRCLVCSSDELFKRKAFPQAWGVAIVVTGFVLSSIAWYQSRIALTFAFLFGCALIDLVLYLMMGDCVVCYRCHAEYHGCSRIEEHSPFNLETHERFRQEAARLAKATKSAAPPGPTAHS